MTSAHHHNNHYDDDDDDDDDEIFSGEWLTTIVEKKSWKWKSWKDIFDSSTIAWMKEKRMSIQLR